MPTQNALTSVIVNTQVQTMTSREIAELVESRHDSVKRTVERCAEKGAFTLPPLVETSFLGSDGRRQTTSVYNLDKISSLVVVAQLCPEFTAKIVLRWQELEDQVSQAAQPTLSPPATLLKSLLDGASILGVPLHLGQSESVKEVRLRTGFDYSPILKLAPAQQNIKREELMLEPTEIGKRLGMTGVKANLMLEDMGLQMRVNGSWEPTENGKRFCVQHHWVAGNKSGYNYKWNVEEVLRRMERVEA